MANTLGHCGGLFFLVPAAWISHNPRWQPPGEQEEEAVTKEAASPMCGLGTTTGGSG